VVSIPLGGIIGIAIANWIIGIDINLIFTHDPNLLIILLACTVAFGTIVSYFFQVRQLFNNNYALFINQ
jgi:cell division protein FtsL